MPHSQPAERRCAECARALDVRQRYCLACGARCGGRDPLLAELLARLLASAGQADALAADAAAARATDAPTAAPASPGPARWPSLRMWVPLTLAFLGFGVLLGDTGSSRVQTLAASRQPLRIVMPAASSPVARSSAGGVESGAPGTSGGSASAAGAPESEATPAPASSASAAEHPVASAAHPTQPPRPSAGESQPAPGVPLAGKLAAIKHVFLIMLSDQPYASVFGPASAAPYLARSLEKRGVLLVRYYAVAHEQLANGVALLSGQGPTPQTEANCPTYTDLAGPQPASGCVYPPSTKTLAAQLEARHLSWRAYVEGLEEGGRAACAHPVLGAGDPSAAQPPPSGAYATFRNPFVYFHAITDSSKCGREDVGLERLAPDLRRASRTPSFSYIVPDRCHDASPEPCAPGAPAGLPAANSFLRSVVPGILASTAYRQSGLLVITVDEAPSGGELADSSSCCGQPSFPLPGANGGGGPAGGGQVGALLLSPLLSRPGSTDQEPYNHFSLLRTLEDVFALAHLGYAAGTRVSAFDAALFSAR